MSAEVRKRIALLLRKPFRAVEVVSETSLQLTNRQTLVAGQHCRQKLEVFDSPGGSLTMFLFERFVSEIDERLETGVGRRRGFRRGSLLFLFFVSQISFSERGARFALLWALLLAWFINRIAPICCVRGV